MWLKVHIVTFKLNDSSEIQTEEIKASSKEDAKIRLRKKHGSITILKVERVDK